MLCVIGASLNEPHTSGTNELHAVPPAARSYALLVLVIQVQGHYRIKFCQYFLCSVWGQTATPIFLAIRYTPHTSLFTCDSLNDIRCVAVSAVWHHVQAVCVILPIDYFSVLHVTFSVLAYLVWTQVMKGHKASCYMYRCSYTCSYMYMWVCSVYRLLDGGSVPFPLRMSCSYNGHPRCECTHVGVFMYEKCFILSSLWMTSSCRGWTL